MLPPPKKIISSDDTIVKVYGPFDNNWGRTVMIKKTPTIRAFIKADNCCIDNLMDYAQKEFKGHEVRIDAVVKDISKIKWLYENESEKPTEQKTQHHEETVMAKKEPVANFDELLKVAKSIDLSMTKLLELFKNIRAGK